MIGTLLYGVCMCVCVGVCVGEERTFVLACVCFCVPVCVGERQAQLLLKWLMI